MARTASIGIRVEPKVKEAAESVAKSERRTLAAVVEIALIEYLQRRGALDEES